MQTVRRIVIDLVTTDDLPDAIRGTIGDDSGRYIMLINGNMTTSDQEETFLHECRHIFNNDTKHGGNADSIEAERGERWKQKRSCG